MRKLIVATIVVVLFLAFVKVKEREPTYDHFKYQVSCPSYQGVVEATVIHPDLTSKITMYSDSEGRPVEFGATSNCVFTQIEKKLGAREKELFLPTVGE